MSLTADMRNHGVYRHATAETQREERMKARLNNNRGISLVVVLMVMAILLTVIGAGLIFSGINTKVAMNYRTGTGVQRRRYRHVGHRPSVTPGVTPSSAPVTLGDNLVTALANATARC